MYVIGKMLCKVLQLSVNYKKMLPWYPKEMISSFNNIFFWYFSVASSAESGSGFMQGSTASTQIVIKPIEKLKIWPGVVKRYQAFKEGDFIVE